MDVDQKYIGRVIRARCEDALSEAELALVETALTASPAGALDEPRRANGSSSRSTGSRTGSKP